MGKISGVFTFPPKFSVWWFYRLLVVRPLFPSNVEQVTSFREVLFTLTHTSSTVHVSCYSTVQFFTRPFSRWIFLVNFRKFVGDFWFSIFFSNNVAILFNFFAQCFKIPIVCFCGVYDGSDEIDCVRWKIGIRLWIRCSLMARICRELKSALVMCLLLR